jgi:hypothetical protein
MSPTYRDSLSEDKNHPGVLSLFSAPFQSNREQSVST